MATALPSLTDGAPLRVCEDSEILESKLHDRRRNQNKLAPTVILTSVGFIFAAASPSPSSARMREKVHTSASDTKPSADSSTCDRKKLSRGRLLSEK